MWLQLSACQYNHWLLLHHSRCVCVACERTVKCFLTVERTSLKTLPMTSTSFCMRNVETVVQTHPRHQCGFAAPEGILDQRLTPCDQSRAEAPCCPFQLTVAHLRKRNGIIIRHVMKFVGIHYKHLYEVVQVYAIGFAFQSS